MEHNFVHWCRQDGEDYTRDVKANRQNIVVYKGATAVEAARVVDAEFVNAAGSGCECEEEGGAFKLDANAADRR